MSTDKTDDKAIRLRLRDVRCSRGLSQNALANKLGINYQRLGRMERGETQVSLNMLHRIANLLQVPLSHLLVDDIGSLKNGLSDANHKNPSVCSIPFIYDTLVVFCKRHKLDIDHSAKVLIATVIFQAIQAIRTKEYDEEESVRAWFQALDAIFDRLALARFDSDDME